MDIFNGDISKPVAFGLVCSPTVCEDSGSGSMSDQNPGPLLEMT